VTPHARAPNIRFCLATRLYLASEEPAHSGGDARGREYLG
jgi:hypothetical protein